VSINHDDISKSLKNIIYAYSLNIAKILPNPFGIEYLIVFFYLE